MLMVVWSSYRCSLLADLHIRHELDTDVSCGATIIMTQLHKFGNRRNRVSIFITAIPCAEK